MPLTVGESVRIFGLSKPAAPRSNVGTSFRIPRKRLDATSPRTRVRARE